jgi:hypothetical protein
VTTTNDLFDKQDRDLADLGRKFRELTDSHLRGLEREAAVGKAFATILADIQERYKTGSVTRDFMKGAYLVSSFVGAAIDAADPTLLKPKVTH